jgi:hypothetical protein
VGKLLRFVARAVDLGVTKLPVIAALSPAFLVGGELAPATPVHLFLNSRRLVMNEMLISMGISIVLTAIKESFKSPTAKSKLKAALLKVRNQINSLYAGDTDFQ